jgi:hypothetical protein
MKLKKCFFKIFIKFHGIYMNSYDLNEANWHCILIFSIHIRILNRIILPRSEGNNIHKIEKSVLKCLV